MAIFRMCHFSYILVFAMSFSQIGIMKYEFVCDTINSHITICNSYCQGLIQEWISTCPIFARTNNAHRFTSNNACTTGLYSYVIQALSKYNHFQNFNINRQQRCMITKGSSCHFQGYFKVIVQSQKLYENISSTLNIKFVNKTIAEIYHTVEWMITTHICMKDID